MTQSLKRSIGLSGLIFYGVGTMVGGGIYALLGKVVGAASIFTPWSMTIAGLMALFSALSFAELSARFPNAGGPAFYITQAFDSKSLGSLFGWLVITTGVVSSATLTVASSGFLLDLLVLPNWLYQLFIVAILGLIAVWGIKQSVLTVAIITLIEIAGLVLVIATNSDNLVSFSYRSVLPSADLHLWLGIFAGGFLAFYAFIGFEDLVTLAEEVKNVESNLPKSIIISLLITLVLYIAISLVAVSSNNLQSFSNSNTPMAVLMKDSNYLSPLTLVVISLLAGLNGALVQVVMSARILYSMGKSGQASKIFSIINSKTQTPVLATFVVILIILMLAWLVDLSTLAKITSAIILFVFAAINLALCKIKKTQCRSKTFCVPYFVPVLGLVVSLCGLLLGLVGQLASVH